MTKPWEDMIASNNFAEPVFNILAPAREHRGAFSIPEEWKNAIYDHLDEDLIDAALEQDQAPIPVTADREGYWGKNHFGYWLSGLRDYKLLLDCCARFSISPNSYLDVGCASGRVIRHFAANSPKTSVIGCDLNRRHIEWVIRYLPSSIVAFQNHSIPTVPLPDDRVDVLSAYSVFTHVEAFETAWLMEIRRILKPGGIAWVTVHSEETWKEMQESWPLYKNLLRYRAFDPETARSSMEQDRLVFRGASDASYSSQVFYRFDYIKSVWSRFLDIVEIHRRLPSHQDVIILRKPK